MLSMSPRQSHYVSTCNICACMRACVMCKYMHLFSIMCFVCVHIAEVSV